ncbi:MAG TPA: DedA family protein [Candidatus Thermoplasmatota archaeon]|nr:DedA family protein [Candidatus Thermoplasmatota archaeon]
MALAGILDTLAQLSLDTVERLHYPGIFLLMTMESMVLPVPSEAVLPPAGWLAYEGKMNLWIALLAATLGTLVGSLLSYAMGYYGLRPLLERYGKYALVKPHHLDLTHTFFERRGGALAIFLARFVPIVRHLISIPAGSARMPIVPFLAATLAGGAAWNLILLAAGYKLGENWHSVTEYVEGTKWTVLALTIVLVAGAAVGWWLKKRRDTGTRLPGE